MGYFVVAYIIGMVFFVFEDYMFNCEPDFVYADKTYTNFSNNWVYLLCAIGLVLAFCLIAVNDMFFIFGCLLFGIVGFMVALYIYCVKLFWGDWVEKHSVLWTTCVIAIGLAVVGLMDLLLYFGGWL